MGDSLMEERLGGAPGYDALGLSPTDRDKLSYLIQVNPQLARDYLEKHFGATFEQIAGEIEETKRYNAKVEKMTEALNRFQLHFPLWLPTKRNQETVLEYLESTGLTEITYQVLVDMWNEYAHIDGKLDLDEGEAPKNRHYVGQITPGSDLDSDFVPRKRISDMSADEFTRNLIRSSKFREKIDGPRQ